MRSLLCLAVLSLAACSDPCGDGSSAASAIENKFATCQAQDPSFFGGFLPCFDQNACEKNLAQCDSHDRAVLEATAACQNAYAGNGDCTFAGLQAYTACALDAGSLPDGGSALSASCAAAFTANPGVCGGA